MASEREWLLLTEERFSREDALRVAYVSLTNLSLRELSGRLPKTMRV